MKTLSETRARLMQDPATRDAYVEQTAEFAIARELIAARAKAGLTQAEVAERMGTTQSVVARLEGGKSLPSLRTLARYASAIGYVASVKLTRAGA